MPFDLLHVTATRDRNACLPRPRSIDSAGPGPVGRGFVTVTQTPGGFSWFAGVMLS
jgi:hypothetical protein